ncbi:MAG: 2-amino-4-hydroxy-6-hydroxymethyldihydropteridine diphosphokinase [Opitutaceae bacterium]|nr:2-amino-4-hydroxy-6-hydroxymethyldihydropteridine diphosphokinase [Opitutaceae bacterium]
MSAAARVRQAFIGAGSNLGDRLATLQGAIERLRAHPAIVAVEQSSVLETDPVGYLDQPVFLNLVFGIETTLEPEALMRSLLETEQHFGRVRTVRWGPRTLDLDLLAFEGETRSTPFLELPHPRLFERAFVTVPLREVLECDRFRRSCWDDLRAKLKALPSLDTRG